FKQNLLTIINIARVPTDGVKTIGSGNNISRFIYVRVTQADGHMAWTSPIWLDFYYDE
ncbi:MAG: hypothetical protein GWP08_21765, partial [Nitrospiraceae bacterium]|nr:hypothetical protein [Nitrospiraceae bacterium]